MKRYFFFLAFLSGCDSQKPYLFNTKWEHKTHYHTSLTYWMNMGVCLRNNASPFLVMLSMCLLICCSQAKQYVVGGTANSWKTPLSSPHSLNHWANSHHFKIGDTLGILYNSPFLSTLFFYFLRRSIRKNEI